MSFVMYNTCFYMRYAHGGQWGYKQLCLPWQGVIGMNADLGTVILGIFSTNPKIISVRPDKVLSEDWGG